MGEFKTIETQEQFDEAIKDRLSRERETIEKKYADYESLKEQVSKFEKAQAEHDTLVSGLNEKIKKLETNSLKAKIASEMGIPHMLAGRLSGEDEKSIRADAATMAPFLKGKHVAPLRNEDSKTGEEDPYKKMLAKIKKED